MVAEFIRQSEKAGHSALAAALEVVTQAVLNQALDEIRPSRPKTVFLRQDRQWWGREARRPQQLDRTSVVWCRERR